MPRRVVRSPELARYGKRLQQIRQDHGYSQEAFADRAGVSVGTLREHEQGRTEIGILALVTYAQALGVQPGTLLDIAPAQQQRADEQEQPETTSTSTRSQRRK